MATISEALKVEMESVFKMLRDAVSRIEEDYWKEKENNWMYGYVLFHIIEAIEFYASDSTKDWKPLSEVSVNSEEKETEILKTKDKTFFEKYLSDVESKAFEVLGKLSEKDLLETDGFSARGATSRLHKFTYVMRHSMVHLGELSKTLRCRGEKGIRWE